MQTPQKNTPQGGRRSSKHHGPKSEAQIAIQSDNDAYLVSGLDGDQTPSRKNRKPRKKSNARKNGVQSDVGEANEHQNHRHSSHAKNTPAKAIKSDAYAGPTFHQSPAASALPMPSFLSRSVPSNNPISTIVEDTDGSPDEKQKVAQEIEEKRESTPLDWMFEAARKGKNTPNGLSKSQITPPLPGESPAGRKEDSDFPFELEGTEDDKSVYSTPLTQRFAASRTPQSISVGGQPLTDAERKAKTDALKKVLLPPGPNQPQPGFSESNPFNAKNAPASPNYPQRHTSNPATPTYSNGYGGSQTNYFQYGPQSPGRNYNYQQNNRPPSSNLRNVYEPNLSVPMSPPNSIPDSRISTARSPQPARALNFGAIYGNSHNRPQSEGNPTGHNPKPSLEQGLDDLKKALNMLGQA